VQISDISVFNIGYSCFSETLTNRNVFTSVKQIIVKQRNDCLIELQESDERDKLKESFPRD
jgi:hypothetical protein